MSIYGNVEQIIQLYLESDRTKIKEKYENIFKQVSQVAEERDQNPILTSDPEVNFQNVLMCLHVSDAISEKLTQVWRGIPDSEKQIAVHFLFLIYNSKWSLAYKLEGLLNFFGVWATTHLIHSLSPDIMFPIDAEQRYDKFQKILKYFGITYSDKEDELPIDIALNISQAIEKFRSQYNLEDWQMWALIYDLGPRLLNTTNSYPTDVSPRIWFTTAGREDFDLVDQHTANDRDIWVINDKARHGDIVLMYLLTPRSSIVAIYRCGCDAYRDPFREWWTGIWTELADKISLPPISLKEMKKDSILKDWHIVKTNFQGLLRHEVPDKYWQRLKDIITKKDSNVGHLLEEYSQSVEGVRAIKDVGDSMSEKEFEEQFVLPLLHNLGWQVEFSIHRQYEMDIKIGSGRPHRVRADFVGFKNSYANEAFLVVECKRRVRNADELKQAIEQCESYAGKLRCARFAIVAPEGLWIYHLAFPTQSQMLKHMPVKKKFSDNELSELSKLIGYKQLSKQSD